eukprot:2727783-Pleurochrysis_carterae.AAC.8
MHPSSVVPGCCAPFVAAYTRIATPCAALTAPRSVYAPRTRKTHRQLQQPSKTITTPTFDELIASDLQIRVEEDFASMKNGSFAAILWRKKAASTWDRCVLLRKAEDNFEIWSERGIDRPDSYSFCRDDDGNLLDDCLEEEFELTLAPPSWLAQTRDVQKPTEQPPASENGDHVAGRYAVHDCVRNALRNLLTSSKEAAPSPTDDVVPGADLLPHAVEEPTVTKEVELPPQPAPTALTPGEDQRYAITGRGLYVWSVTPSMVGVVFDDTESSWTCLTMEKFACAATLLTTSEKGAVNGVVMPPTPAKGVKCPAATLFKKQILPDAEANEWTVYRAYVQGTVSSKVQSSRLACKSSALRRL